MLPGAVIRTNEKGRAPKDPAYRADLKVGPYVERRTSNGERRTANGERQTANVERRT